MKIKRNCFRRLILTLAVTGSFHSFSGNSWPTYFGGSSSDRCQAIAVDNSGNVYITGHTYSPDFPTSLGAYQGSHAGSLVTWDGFVVKMNSSGALVWATYYGGADNDVPTAIAVDNSGNVVIGGYTTSLDLPLNGSSYQSTNRGGAPYGDGFVAKFNSAGILDWATYIGGTSSDVIKGVAIDNAGNIYTDGITYSNDMLTSVGAFQASYGGGMSDGFISKFSSVGTLIFNTYFGKSNIDALNAIALDNNSNLFVSGYSNSNNLPLTAGTFQPAMAGGTSSGDAILVKLSLGGAPVWTSYFGGKQDDASIGVVTDNSGNVYISGYTFSSNFPTTAGAFQQQALNPSQVFETFLVKMTTAGARSWSTLLGGSGNDYATGIGIDGHEMIYVSGWTSSSDMPTTSCSYQNAYGGGGHDGYVGKFSTTGVLSCLGYFGESGDEFNFNISAKGNNVYFCGYSGGPIATAANAYQPANAGADDLFIEKICSSTCGLKTNGPDFIADQTTICSGLSINFMNTSTVCDKQNTPWSWNFPGADSAASTIADPSGILYSTPGTYSVKLLDVTCDRDSLIKNDYVLVTNCDQEDTYIPNSISPNGDGLNDMFSPYLVSNKNYSIRVFDRWGKIVFQSADVNNSWNGRLNNTGNILQEDVYSYVINFDVSGDHPTLIRGHVNLIR